MSSWVKIFSGLVGVFEACRLSPATIELAGATLKGLLSPALSSKAGEGAQTADPLGSPLSIGALFSPWKN